MNQMLMQFWIVLLLNVKPGKEYYHLSNNFIFILILNFLLIYSELIVSKNLLYFLFYPYCFRYWISMGVKLEVCTEFLDNWDIKCVQINPTATIWHQYAHVEIPNNDNCSLMVHTFFLNIS